jgi:hypothetical protein
MARTLLSFLVLIFLITGLTGQTSVNFPPTKNDQDKTLKLLIYPDKPSRTFLGKAGIASLEIFGMEAFTSTIMILLPKRITNWEEKYWLYFGLNFKRAYTKPPVWDKDPWPVNYIGHPYQGAVFFNSLRSQNCSFWASAAFNLFHTLLWEYGPEAIMERPSIQDLITTPVTGITFGELFHFLTKKMRRGGFTIGEKILVTLINPAYVVNNGYR